MKLTKKATAVILTALLLITLSPFTAFAKTENTPKEEVVYINLKPDGSVREINVVNIFNLEGNSTITDYGKYQCLRNMTTTDKIEYSDNVITINTDSEKLYYEGKPESSDIPWNISLRYYIDGKEYTSDKLAGKSGKLKIKMTVEKNKNCAKSFFGSYALQASFTLDTKKCSNINADGATVANVGSDKQITYTILPGNSADIEINADVKDFEMDGISINGVRLNMDFTVDDAKIQDKISEIVGAVENLDDGADSLNNGTKSLYDATDMLNGKIGGLNSATGALSGGAQELYSGLAAITAKNDDLTGSALSAYEGLCKAAEIQINTQLTENGLDTVNLTPSSYSDVLSDLLKKMNADAVYEQAYNAALKEVTAQVEAQADTLYNGYIESKANSIYLSYIESQSETLCSQVASQAVYEQLIAAGYTDRQADSYLQTTEGQGTVAQAANSISKEQKSQIISGAVAKLTEEQKAEIRRVAVTSLTNEQKTQIRNTYVEQMMAKDEVKEKLTAAVSSVSSAAAGITELKCQLDSYGIFYQGIIDYTSAVSNAASGANILQINLDTLYSNTGILENSVGELNGAVKKLYDGTTDLKNGTDEFADETSGMDTQVSNEIDSMLSSVSGGDAETISFVSEQNTNIESVQFVIKTDAVKMAEAAGADEKPEQLNFWQKLLKLFGLY